MPKLDGGQEGLDRSSTSAYRHHVFRSPNRLVPKSLRLSPHPPARPYQTFMKKKKIFVSHIALDAVLALELKKWIELAFKGKCVVFVSSSFEDIEPGAPWVRELRQALGGAELLLVICTRKSVNSRWVLFETGCVWGREVTILPIVCDEQLELPVLLSENQILQFSDPSFSQTLNQQVAKTLRLPVPSYPAYNKMRNALQEAYNKAKLDSDIIDRIKHVKADRSLRVKECSAPSLAAHFRIPLADMSDHLVALATKGYLNRVKNKLIGDYYSLTPKTERLLL
jgi:hypothetical protein